MRRAGIIPSVPARKGPSPILVTNRYVTRRSAQPPVQNHQVNFWTYGKRPDGLAVDVLAAGCRSDKSSPGYVHAELRRRGGFIPLLHLMPHPRESSTEAAALSLGLLRPIPWSRADFALRNNLCTTADYEAAASCAPCGGG